MMKVGSDEHKRLFCRALIDTHNAYEPEELPWPVLDDTTLGFLRSISVWTTALKVEVNAGAMLHAFAATQTDVMIREAIDLQAYEEERHGRMIQALIDRYGLQADRVVADGPTNRAAFISFGYNECLDSFFGFGIFALAQKSGVVSRALVDLFSRVIAEEARHIVFFVNWIAFERARHGLRGSLLQAVPSAIGYAGALALTMRRAGKEKIEEQGMASAGAVFPNFTPAGLLRECLAANDRYMRAFDPRLLRPRVIPALARAALFVSKLVSAPAKAGDARVRPLHE